MQQPLAPPPLSTGLPGRRWGLLLAALGVLLSLALLARLLAAPVARDEQIYFAVSMLGGHHHLYQDLGFNHLPNLPLLAGPLLALADRPFLVARLLVFAAWAASLALVAALALRATGSRALAALAMLLLASSPLLLNETGTLFSNNFLPVPFALGGVLMFLRALERPAASAPLLFAAGLLLALAAGFKGNHIFVAAAVGVASLLVPPALPFGRRLATVALPLLVGGIVGALPTLLYLAADAPGFLAHVVGYHSGPHRAHAALSTEPLVISAGERILLARQLWGDGGTLLTGFLCLLFAILLLARGWRPGLQVWLVAALVLLGGVLSFIPSPSFPQYFSLPVPWLILLLLLLAGALRPAERTLAAPALLALALAVVAVDGPRLLRDLPRLAQPAGWVPMQVHAISAQVASAAGGQPVATFSPIYALEAGGRIYPALAGGPFLFRVADLIPPDQLRHYGLVLGPRNIQPFLLQNPPGAILVGEHPALDPALLAHARATGMAEVPLDDARTAYGQLRLFVPHRAGA